MSLVTSMPTAFANSLAACTARCAVAPCRVSASRAWMTVKIALSGATITASLALPAKSTLPSHTDLDQGFTYCWISCVRNPYA